MSDFESLRQEAEHEAEGHPAQVDEGVTKAEEEVDDKTGGSYSSDVGRAGSELEDELGDNQAAPPPQQ